MRDCGGCQGKGAHWKWCAKEMGLNAAVRGRWGTSAENLADQIGSNYPDVANMLYSIAGRMYDESKRFDQRLDKDGPVE